MRGSQRLWGGPSPISGRVTVPSERDRREAEVGIQVCRGWGIVIAAFQTALRAGDSSLFGWSAVAVLVAVWLACRWALSRDLSVDAVRRLGVGAMAGDTVVTALMLANFLSDPADPIQMMPLVLAAEGAVRWGRMGGVIVGIGAGAMSGAWAVAVHSRQDLPLPPSYVTFRLAIVVLLGLLMGTTVSAVRRHRRLAETVVEASSDLIVGCDGSGVIRTVNPACRRILGWEPDELLGRNRADFIALQDRPDGPPDLDFLRRAGGRHIELRFVHKLGHLVWLEFDIQVDGSGDLVFAIGRDVSDRRQAEAELRHRADHDSLTGAANRAHFIARLGLELQEPESLVVLFVDLDRFKVINDLYGHRTGDSVLVEVAARLGAVTRPRDLVVRLSGDEFCVLLVAPIAEDEARAVVERIGASLSEPFCVADREVRLGASVGSAASRPTDRPVDLLERADEAMYEIKRTRHGGATAVVAEARAVAS